MYQQIFKNTDLQSQFDKQGFVVLPFLTAEDISELTTFFYQLHPQLPDDAFSASSYSTDLAYKKTVSNRITDLFVPHFETHFQNYSPFGSAFLCKTPGKNSQLMMHQDWTIVDEHKYLALNIWVPLVDTNEENGTLFVLPGSHSRNLFTLRAPTLPFFFTGNETLVANELEPICVPAGTAIVLNQSLVHYSPPNLSGKLRIAITSGIKSKNAQMVFHYQNLQNANQDVEVFEQEDDFLISFDNFHEDIFNRPKMGNSIGHITYKVPSFTKEELANLVEKMKLNAGYALKTPKKQNEHKASWWKKWFSKMSSTS